MRPFVPLTSKRMSLAFIFCLPELLIKRFQLLFQRFPLALQQQKSRQQTRQRTHQPIQTHLGALMRPFVLLTSKRKSLAFIFQSLAFIFCLPELLLKRFQLLLKRFQLIF
jgi:hypothetical protein